MSVTVLSCMNCGGDRASTVYADCPDYYLGTPFRVDYVKCDRCGLVQQSPVPADTSVFYEAYPVHGEKSPFHDLSRRLIMAASYADASEFPEGAVVPDYGCGDGWYLESLKGRGLDLVGFEPDPGYAAVLAARLDLPVYADSGALAAEHAVVESLAREHGMRFVGQRPVPLSNGIAGSLPVALAGRFVYPLFLFFLPLGVVLSRLVPTGCTAFSLEKPVATVV